VFADAFEDWPNTDGDLSNLNAISVEASNPGFANLDNILIHYDYMNAVCTQYLIVNDGLLTYHLALQDVLAPQHPETPRRLNSSLF
jgi:hypothetical protein